MAIGLDTFCVAELNIIHIGSPLHMTGMSVDDWVES